MKRPLFSTVFFLVAAHAANGQQRTVPDSLLALNRTGHWSEAATLATARLKANPSAPVDESCRIREGLLWAQLRLGRIASARATLDQYDRTCAVVKTMRPFAKEVAGIRKELGDSPTARPAIQ